MADCHIETELCADQGSTLHTAITLSEYNPATEEYEPLNLAGVTLEFAVAAARGETPIHVFDSAPEVEVVDAAAGRIAINIPPMSTAEWDTPPGGGSTIPARKKNVYQYALRLFWPDGLVETILSGDLCIRLSVVA